METLEENLKINKNTFLSYRNLIKTNNNCIFLNYKYSDLLILFEAFKPRESIYNFIICKALSSLKEIYEKLESVISSDLFFKGSLRPVKIRSFYPQEIKKMCAISAAFEVGPMASVAGLVNEYLAEKILGVFNSQNCIDKKGNNANSANNTNNLKTLILENGGDLYINSNKDVEVGIFLQNSEINKFYKSNSIVLKIAKELMPCGLCSSSSKFGRSLSLGKCDLAVVLADSCIAADAAATALANSIKTEADIKASIDYFSKFKQIKGLFVIKDKKIGIWGNLKLA